MVRRAGGSRFCATSVQMARAISMETATPDALSTAPGSALWAMDQTSSCGSPSPAISPADDIVGSHVAPDVHAHAQNDRPALLDHAAQLVPLARGDGEADQAPGSLVNLDASPRELGPRRRVGPVPDGLVVDEAGGAFLEELESGLAAEPRQDHLPEQSARRDAVALLLRIERHQPRRSFLPRACWCSTGPPARGSCDSPPAAAGRA